MSFLIHAINIDCCYWVSVDTLHLVILSFERYSTSGLLMCTQSWIDRHLNKNFVLFLMLEKFKKMTVWNHLTVDLTGIYKRALNPGLVKQPLVNVPNLIFVLQTSLLFVLDCPEGLYGSNCLQNCSMTCGDPGRCDIMTGHCNGGCPVSYTHLTLPTICSV